MSDETKFFGFFQYIEHYKYNHKTTERMIRSNSRDIRGKTNYIISCIITNVQNIK